MYNTNNAVDEIMINTLINLGNQYKEEYNYPLSQKSYQQALNIHEKLSLVNPKRHKPFMIEILNLLSALYEEQNKYNLAIECYREIITIGRVLYRNNSDVQYLSLLAQTYTNIADLHKEHHSEQIAKYFYAEAVESYAMLITKEDYSHHHINQLSVHLSLIAIYEKELLFNEAKEHYINALYTCEILVNSGFESYLLEKSKLHCDLASLYFFQNIFDLAKENYQASLDILSSLTNLETDMDIESFAIVHNNLASIYAFEEEYSKALFHYKKALPFLTGLAEKNPTKFGQNVAILFKNLASVYIHEQNLEKAQFFHFKSIDIFKEFSEYNAEKYNIELALCIVDGVEYYGQHTLSLYKAEDILRKYNWNKEAEMLLGRICSLRKSSVKEKV